jgi:hypothetical protein
MEQRNTPRCRGAVVAAAVAGMAIVFVVLTGPDARAWTNVLDEARVASSAMFRDVAPQARSMVREMSAVVRGATLDQTILVVFVAAAVVLAMFTGRK